MEISVSWWIVATLNENLYLGIAAWNVGTTWKILALCWLPICHIYDTCSGFQLLMAYMTYISVRTNNSISTEHKMWIDTIRTHIHFTFPFNFMVTYTHTDTHQPSNTHIISCSLPPTSNNDTNQDTYTYKHMRYNWRIEHNLQLPRIQFRLQFRIQSRLRLSRLRLQFPKLSYNSIQCLLDLLQFFLQFGSQSATASKASYSNSERMKPQVVGSPCI